MLYRWAFAVQLALNNVGRQRASNLQMHCAAIYMKSRTGTMTIVFQNRT